MTIVSATVADRVKENTSTTGGGTIDLGGASPSYQSFAQAFGATVTITFYCILSGNGTDWEVGQGTFTPGSPNTLSRDTVLASSNSGSAINLTGTSVVFCDAPAAWMNPMTQIGLAALYQAATALFGGI